MQRYDFFFRQKVTEAELDAAFDGVEQRFQNWPQDHGLTGIALNADVTENAGTPNLTVDIAGTSVVYDQLGNRISWAAAQDVDVSVDENSTATAVTTPGNSKYLSIFAKFERTLSDPRLDGNSNSVFFNRAEGFTLNVVQGAEAVSPTRPALRADEILLCDILLAHGATSVVNGDIDITRRQDIFNVTSGAFNIRANNLQDFAQGMLDEFNSFTVTPLATGVTYGGGNNWADGTTNPSATVEAHLDKVIDDLAATSGSPGTAKIGSEAVTSGTVSLPAGPLNAALVSAAAQMDGKLDKTNGGTVTGTVTFDGVSSDPLIMDESNIRFDGNTANNKIIWVSHPAGQPMLEANDTSGDRVQVYDHLTSPTGRKVRLFSSYVSGGEGMEVTNNADWNGTTWDSDTGTGAIPTRVVQGELFDVQLGQFGNFNEGDWQSRFSVRADGSSTTTDVDLRDGRIQMTNATAATNPAPATTPDINALYAKNIPKAWGKITIDSSGNITSVDGFNVNTPPNPGASPNVSVTFATAMANTGYCVVTGDSIVNSNMFKIAIGSASNFIATLVDMSTGASVNLDSVGTTTTLHFTVFGTQ
jgi:hypothetical protein